MYKNLDKENMFNAIWEFPDNLSEANRLGENIKLEQDYSSINSIVVAGMGGSAMEVMLFLFLKKSVLMYHFSFVVGILFQIG